MDHDVQLLFVCLGNICRSPTAEAVMAAILKREGLEAQIQIDSAGTGSWHAGNPADPRSQAAAQKRGYTLTSRARRVQLEDFERFDYLLAMDQSNYEDLLAMAPTEEAKERVHLFRAFDPTAEDGAEVPDPYYGSGDGFALVLDQCERAAAGLLTHLQRRG